MSRVAKSPIHLPKGVEFAMQGQQVQIKGPKGTMQHAIPEMLSIKQSDSDDGSKLLQVSVDNATDNSIALAGTTRAVVNNMVKGVSDGFEIELELIGVGYRAQAKGKTLELSLGFSHPVEYALPEGVTAETPANTRVVLKASDNQRLGQAAAEIRAYRLPEPYKGKGIRYLGEVIVRKETKKK